MGEKAFHLAIKEGGIAGTIGAVVGAILGWPHAQQSATLGGLLVVTTYHNAFASGEFQHVIEAGLFGGGVVAVGMAALGALLFGRRNRD